MKKKITARFIKSLFFMLVVALSVVLKAQNPFLPPWEYIPDGEPRVFGDRVYIYGSHDKAGSRTFCDTKYVVWSAPLNDLTNWYKEGESFYSKADKNGIDDVSWSDNDLYAPDLVEKGGKYYLYVYIVGAPGCIAVSDVPGGPFKYLSKYQAPAGSPPEFGGWGQYIDPGVLVDDDGKVYIYWGYKRSYMAQINPDNMYEILPGTYKEDIIPTASPFNFFEGASMRKINGTYYFVYAQGSSLAYATSASPTGPFNYGGVIVRNGKDYPGGNIHGSLCEINGQWYIFYHRMTNNTIMSRKACAERVTIKPDGSIDEVEMTSLGFSKSLDPYKEHSPYIACVLKGGNYITEIDSFSHPVIKNKHESIIGFKYFDFTSDTITKYTQFSATFRNTDISGEMEIWVDSPEPVKGRKIGFIDVIKPADKPTEWRTISGYIDTISGVHALYFRFLADVGTGLIGDLKSFSFSKTDTSLPNPPNNRPYIIKEINNYYGYIHDKDCVGFANLNQVFYDIEDTNTLVFSIDANSDAAFVSPSITHDSILNLSFGSARGGIERVTVKAVDKGGKAVFSSFYVFLRDPLSPNKALAQKSFSSSEEGQNYTIENINDGDMSTRWSSTYEDSQHVIFTLDSAYLVKKVMLYWEAAHGKDYNVWFSQDSVKWEKVATIVNSNGGTDKIIIEGNVTSKYIKFELVNRNTSYGFSLWEVEFYKNSDNKSPVATVSVPNQNALVGEKFSLTLPKNPFTDDGDSLSFSLVTTDGTELPSWIDFDNVLLTLSGTPAQSDTGIVNIAVKASDIYGGEGLIKFSISVEAKTSKLTQTTNTSVKLYPNPASDKVSIRINNFEAKEISVLSISGKTLANRQLSQSAYYQEIEIDLPFSDGLYFIKLVSTDIILVEKLVIKKER